MSFKSSIWAGRFARDTYEPAEAIAEREFVAVLNRFADRDEAGGLVVPNKRPGWEQLFPKKLLGRIDNEIVIYHFAGYVEVIFLSADPRIDAFLAALCRELGCELLDSNSGERVADYFLAVADKDRHNASG